uniref:Uncharacterized protein n=1 Tax=Mantoniella antarctica TaxID=81844 RepID=A0A7S0SKV2_9CHLO|mmetsp:Transcript_28921/g.72361  ORF Transcript_28921/g.72361 Transcript_28921/m.72361 type:complete len:168 (+) Transcript_28921:102-605(+)
MLVVASGRGDLVTSLLEAGSKIDKAHGEHGITALYAAVEYGDRACAAAMVTALLRAGASVDKTQSAGRTPLHKAAQRGHEAVMALLHQAGADVNKATATTSTVIRCAALSIAGGLGHVAVVALLLQAGCASRQGAQSWSDTALLRSEFWACRGGGFAASNGRKLRNQ